MKTATYDFIRVGKPKIIGIVTQNHKGKISISLPYSNKYNSSTADRYAAKNLGKKIAEANFEHPAITSFVDKSDSSGLIEKLKNSTIDLKHEYVAKCKAWESENFKKKEKWLKLIKSLSLEELYKKFDISFTKKESCGSEIFTINKDRANLVTLNANIRLAEIYLAKGFEKNISKAEQAAITHYENSIVKLAYRLTEKGITDNSEIKIESGKVGQNFECFIISGDIKIKAWTIIAEGPIQKPHYRYLIK
jgi:hypothetical protein